MKLADGKGELLELFRGPQFRDAVLARLPDLAEEVEGDDGIHWVMACLARATMTALEHGNEARARDILTFLDQLLDRRDLDPEIPNAVSISFLEPGSVRKSAPGRLLWESMPPRIRERLER